LSLDRSTRLRELLCLDLEKTQQCLAVADSLTKQNKNRIMTGHDRSTFVTKPGLFLIRYYYFSSKLPLPCKLHALEAPVILLVLLLY